MHSSEVQQAKFPTTKFRAGYDMAEVDNFLEGVRSTLLHWEAGRTGQIRGNEVVAKRFSITKFRLGYDQDHVDNFLDLVTATLNAYEIGGMPGR